jgi:hypothetical protein
MTPAERRTLLALTITCAVLGAAAATWFGSAPPEWRLLVVAGAALLSVPVAWWSTTRPADVARPTGAGRIPTGAYPADPEPQPGRTGEPTAWWSRTADNSALAPTSPDPVTRRPEPPADTQIAQCPRCGDFRLDVHRDGPTFGFRCTGGCGHAWTWAVGTPWPPTVVRRASDHRNRVAHAVTDNRE